MEKLIRNLLKGFSIIVELKNKIMDKWNNISTKWKVGFFFGFIVFSVFFYFLEKYIPAKFFYNFGIIGFLYFTLNICINYMESMNKDIGINSIFFILVTIPIFQIDFFSSFFISLL